MFSKNSPKLEVSPEDKSFQQDALLHLTTKTKYFQTSDTKISWAGADASLLEDKLTLVVALVGKVYIRQRKCRNRFYSYLGECFSFSNGQVGSLNQYNLR